MKLLLFFNFFLLIKTKFNFVHGDCFTSEHDLFNTKLMSSVRNYYKIGNLNAIPNENQIFFTRCVPFLDLGRLGRKQKCVNGYGTEVTCTNCGQIDNFDNLKIFI